jgi:NAD(P)-dependent dehydrogenase (short-subunit alcohol dehydrogenase family)
MSLKNHHKLLLTGAAGGLGQALRQRLKANCEVLRLSDRISPGDAGPGEEVVLADLADAAAVDALVPAVSAHFGKAPDLLVNNASRFVDDTAASATAAEIATHHAVNTAAPIALALALHRTGNRGAVVNIVDQRVRNPVPDQFSYGLSKSALAAATRTLAVSLAPQLRVNAVAPGLTLPTRDYDDALMARIVSAMPLGRLPSPSDIADAVAFLASAESTTGQTLFVDGGASLKSFDRDFVFL